MSEQSEKRVTLLAKHAYEDTGEISEPPELLFLPDKQSSVVNEIDTIQES